MMKSMLRLMFFTGMLFVNLVGENSDYIGLLELSGSEVFIPSKLGPIRVFHDESGFKIMKDGDLNVVQNCFVDKEVRNLSDEELSYFLGTIKDVEINGEKQTLVKISEKDFEDVLKDIDTSVAIQLSDEESSELISQLASSSYLVINEMSDGEYCIHAKTRVLGGGAFGWIAGAMAGKVVVHAIGGIVAGAAGVGGTIVGGPIGGWAAAAGTWGLIAPTIEATSTAVALAAGIAAGVATGPV